ncbi:hypothetical protein [Aquipuribacter sp. SD81]|uniref:hypothetical protein n=1 Tax=Aquipuribacter sp. SD81 TaxID=3127703 RepID=UPI00301885FC
MLPEPRTAAEAAEREAARVVSRLDALAPARVPVELVRGHVQDLADLARAAEGLPPHAVPDLAPHGWADLVRVLVGDLRLLETGEATWAAAADLLAGLRRALP